MALTKITQGVIKSNENYDTNNINSIGIITATGITVTGDLNVAGVLTYDDVTNIDSVGIVTAQTGIHVTGGSVGIGTDNPQEDLHIGSNSPYILLDDYDNNYKWKLKGTAWFAIEDTTAGEDRLRIMSDGNVGIGTDNPAGKLHLSSGESGDCVLILESDTDNNQESDNSYIEFRQDGGLAHSKVGLEDNELVIANSAVLREGIVFRVGDSSTPGWQQATEKLRITSSGGVGIGTNNPIGTNALTDNTSTLAVGIATVGALHVNGNAYPSAGALSNRNLVVNGAMRISQRETSLGNQTNGGYKCLDRFRIGIVNLGTWTYTQSTDAPAGFSRSFKCECTTADASPAAGDLFNIQHRMEGQELQRLKKGTSSAESFTVSFWVKSNKTGTYNLQAEDTDNTRTNVRQYSIESANTWEYKTLTFDGDTTGALDDNTEQSFRLIWWLGSGTNYSSGTTPSTWEAVTATNNAVGNVNLADSTSNVFYITGVQMETGSVATPFEHLTYNDDLTRCQRYYTRYDHSSGGMGLNAPGFYNTASVIFNTIFLPTPMRTENMALTYSDLTHFDLEPWDYGMSSVTLYRIAPNCVTLTGNPATTRSTGDVAFLTIDTTNAWIAFESEL